jgi:hypothetical protein
MQFWNDDVLFYKVELALIFLACVLMLIKIKKK